MDFPVWFKEFDWSPDPVRHLWDEKNHRLYAWSYRPTSEPILINALVAEWEHIPAARLRNLWESLHSGVEAATAAYMFGMKCSTINALHPHTLGYIVHPLPIKYTEPAKRNREEENEEES